MVLGSTQPLTEISTRSISLGVKAAGRCVRLKTYHHPVPLSRNVGALTSWNPLGLSRPVMRLIYLYLYLKYLYSLIPQPFSEALKMFCRTRRFCTKLLGNIPFGQTALRWYNEPYIDTVIYRTSRPQRVLNVHLDMAKNLSRRSLGLQRMK